MSSPNITRIFGLPLLAVVAILRSLELLRSLDCFEARFRLRTSVTSTGTEWREVNTPVKCERRRSIGGKRCYGVPLVDQVDPTAQSSDPIAGVFSRLGELRAFEKTSACEIGPSAKTDKGINAYLVPRSEFLLSDPCERRNFRISDVERYWEN